MGNPSDAEIEAVALIIMKSLWKQEQYNGVTENYDDYRNGKARSMGGRVENYESKASEIAKAAIAAMNSMQSDKLERAREALEAIPDERLGLRMQALKNQALSTLEETP